MVQSAFRWRKVEGLAGTAKAWEQALLPKTKQEASRMHLVSTKRSFHVRTPLWRPLTPHQPPGNLALLSQSGEWNWRSGD